MELLWLEVDFGSGVLNAAGEAVTFEMSLGATPTAILGIDDPRVITKAGHTMQILTSGGSVTYDFIRVDMQSLDGYGYLLASDSFNVSIVGTATSTAFKAEWRLYYRFVDVPVTEYVGIVQSASSV